METNKNVFERYEKKYLLTNQQYDSLMEYLHNKVHIDQYGETTILNIYYDTPAFELIRKSLERPVYKEKLRLRCYGTPNPESPAFVELKKKYEGIVYKRRECMTYEEATAFILSPDFPNPTQVEKEISYFVKAHSPILPAMMIACERIAMVGNDDPELRITFDRNIRYRKSDLELTHGSFGTPIIDDNSVLMEVKIKDALSAELAYVFSVLRIFPVSFSKYGTAYSYELRNTLSAHVPQPKIIKQKVRTKKNDRHIIQLDNREQHNHSAIILGGNNLFRSSGRAHRTALFP